MTTSVIDTADWAFVVPLKVPLALSSSRLTAVMTPTLGGPAAVSLDSADGSIAWTADSAGLTDHLVLDVPVAARSGWLADQRITLAFDVHRTVAGSSADEWLGRSSVLVLPASDSSLVRQAAGFSPVLVPGQPGSGVVLPALTTGPQGPEGRPGTGGAVQLPAGMALSGHRVVRPASDGRLVYASCLTPGDVFAALGVTTGAADPDAPVTVVVADAITEPSWAWLPGVPVWLGPDGALVQPAPALGDLRQIALALTPTRLAIALGSPLIRT